MPWTADGTARSGPTPPSDTGDEESSTEQAHFTFTGYLKQDVLVVVQSLKPARRLFDRKWLKVITGTLKYPNPVKEAVK